jgi:hypothetical protein
MRSAFPVGIFLPPLAVELGGSRIGNNNKKNIHGCLPEIIQDQIDLKKGPNGREKNDLAKMPRRVWDGGAYPTRFLYDARGGGRGWARRRLKG